MILLQLAYSSHPLIPFLEMYLSLVTLQLKRTILYALKRRITK